MIRAIGGCPAGHSMARFMAKESCWLVIVTRQPMRLFPRVEGQLAEEGISQFN